MVKADLNRDYYGDLDLPTTADAEAIKKQFRKLALKYHPDRNPGREAEVNSKFQTIQSAHEVLTTPEQKARYDAHIARNRLNVRFPAASGVRGNPWSRMGDQFPRPPTSPNAAKPPNPPKRPNMPKRPTTSGADKYKDFTARPPPSSPKPPNRDPDPTWKAWANMRPGSKGKASPTEGSSASGGGAKGPGPQPIPRANSTRQQASFGHRVNRTGFTPSSPGGDEPPVTNKNYFTTRTHTNLFNETSSNARNRRRASSNADSTGSPRDSFLDPRQSTPYQTRGGERLNPFDGTPKRSTSTREPPRPKFTKTEATSPLSNRQRSASVPGTPEDAKDSGGSSTPSSRAEERYKPRDTKGGASTAPNSSTTSLNGGQGAANGTDRPNANGNPNVYAQPDTFVSPPFHVHPNGQPPQHPISHAGCGVYGLKSLRNISAQLRELSARMSSSEDPSEGLNPFEHQLRELLDGLAVNHSPLSARKQTLAEKYKSTPLRKGKRSFADKNDPNSFSFKFDEDVFTPNTHRFTRNSAESINTRFVDQEQANSSWQFNAGGVETDGTTRPTPPRSRSSGRLGRRSPFRTQSRQASFVDPAETDKTPTKQGSFDAEEWSQKIIPEIFVPQQIQRKSVSPTRGARAATKKGRPVRQTMGTAGMVDEEESSSGPDDKTRPATAASNLAGQPQSTNSPSAMDIDSPPVQPSVKLQTNGARNIPVEPSRPDWRAGDVDGVKADAKAAPIIPPSFAANAGGSEDSEEFRASFDDFRKVEPFAEKATGLNSFGDLKSNLPFESKASTRPPLKKQKPKQTKLTLPHPPEAPRPPPTLAVPSLKTNPAAWQRFVEAFHQYMRDWHVYNTKFVEHFHAREVEIQRVKTLNDFSWLDARDNSGIQEYLAWAEQDRQVRDQWTTACNSHEQHVREFMAHREKMKVELA